MRLLIEFFSYPIYTSFSPSKWNLYLKLQFLAKKSDGEKWSTKNVSEILPCGSQFLLIHFTYLLVLRKITNLVKQKQPSSRMEENKKYIFLPYLLDLIQLLDCSRLKKCLSCSKAKFAGQKLFSVFGPATFFQVKSETDFRL